MGDFYLGSLDIYQGKNDILSIYFELADRALFEDHLL